MTRQQSVGIPTNEQIINMLLQRLKSKAPLYFPQFEGHDINVKRSALEVRHWSFILYVDFTSLRNGKRKGVVVKIPKALRSEDRVFAAIQCSAAKVSGEQEYITLKRACERFLKQPSQECIIRPLDYFHDTNAIVTERCFGRHLYKLCRQRALLPSVAQTDTTLSDLFRRCGQWLACFHRELGDLIVQKSSLRDFNEAMGTTMALFRSLPLHSLPISRIDSALLPLGNSVHKLWIAKGLDGFDVRDVLVQAGKLFMLDLRQNSKGCIGEDLARFTVSIKSVFWGSPWLFLQPQSLDEYAACFLRGYFGEQSPPRWLLYFILKELGIRWKEAIASLEEHHYPYLVTRALLRVYVDRFYRNEVLKTLQEPG